MHHNDHESDLHPAYPAHLQEDSLELRLQHSTQIMMIITTNNIIILIITVITIIVLIIIVIKA